MFTTCSRVNETQLVSLTSLGYKKKLTLQAPTPQNRQTQSTIRRQQLTNFLSVFDHFVGLALKCRGPTKIIILIAFI